LSPDAPCPWHAGEKSSNYHKEEAQHLIGDYLQGHLQLQEVTSYLTKQFGLSAYLEALLRSRKVYAGLTCSDQAMR
jgi:hypothetical protein